MTVIQGNIVTIVQQHGGVLVHQVNCQRVAGVGLALAIARKWPVWWTAYHARNPRLGACSMTSPTANIHIADIYGQNFYGRDRRYTDYAALEQGLRELNAQLTWLTNNLEGPHTFATVYVPVGLGCGNAGGDWNVVQPLIEKHLPHAILVEYRP